MENFRKKAFFLNLSTSELKVLYAYYKGGPVYSEKKSYGVSTTEELDKIIEKLMDISATEYSSYNYTQDHSIRFGNDPVISSYGKQLLREAGMLS